MLLEKEIIGLVAERSLLGQDCYGKAFKIHYKGRDAVVKMTKSRTRAHVFREEVQMLVDLNGRGGPPRVLTIC